MRVDQDPRLPTATSSTFIPQLTQILRNIAKQLNPLSEGSISAVTNATTAAPTGGTYAQGDRIKNSQPSELGTTGSKYVITGWICTASGTPGTWLPMRTLTGN